MSKIPKIIHYCWFGGNPIPENLQQCIDTWKKFMPDYVIMRWDESNCSFDENPFIREAYEEKKWAFVSDYYRLVALLKCGGIYLDTDVKVYRRFDDLLQYPAFLNFNYDCVIGTAVIGAEKNSKLIAGILDMYDKTVLLSQEEGRFIQWHGQELISYGFNTNNYYFTYYILNNYPDFLLNGKRQDMEDFILFPKELFEIGRLFGGYYAIHLNEGSWHETAQHRDKIKKLLRNCPFVYDKIQIIVRGRRYKRINKQMVFYPYALAQMKGENLPKL